MINSIEEYGQYLQNLIDRYREDLSILLDEYGIDGELNPALLVQLHEADKPLLMEILSQLEYDDDDNLYHAEGSSVIDKLSGIFKKGADLVKGVKAVAGSKSENGPPPPPEPEKSHTKTIIIDGVIIVIVLTVVLIRLKKKK